MAPVVDIEAFAGGEKEIEFGKETLPARYPYLRHNDFPEFRIKGFFRNGLVMDEGYVYFIAVRAKIFHELTNKNSRSHSRAAVHIAGIYRDF